MVARCTRRSATTVPVISVCIGSLTTTGELNPSWRAAGLWLLSRSLAFKPENGPMTPLQHDPGISKQFESDRYWNAEVAVHVHRECSRGED